MVTQHAAMMSLLRAAHAAPVPPYAAKRHASARTLYRLRHCRKTLPPTPCAQRARLRVITPFATTLTPRALFAIIFTRQRAPHYATIRYATRRFAARYARQRHASAPFTTLMPRRAQHARRHDAAPRDTMPPAAQRSSGIRHGGRRASEPVRRATAPRCANARCAIRAPRARAKDDVVCLTPVATLLPVYMLRWRC